MLLSIINFPKSSHYFGHECLEYHVKLLAKGETVIQLSRWAMQSFEKTLERIDYAGFLIGLSSTS